MNINSILSTNGSVNSKPQQTYSLQDRFLSLLERHVQELTVHGSRATGLCPFHPDRTPSFRADLEKCIWHCFPCGHGGGVKKFAQLLGEPWAGPQKRDPKALARRIALQAAHDSFRNWSRRKLTALTDEYREELPLELEIAETACDQVQRCPDLYTLDEKMWWVERRYALREQREALEHKLDLLTYKQNELSCVEWWKNETEREDATRNAA